MQPSKRFDVVFIGGSAIAFLAACLLLALLRLRLIDWYFGNCGDAPACSTAAVFIEYAWAPFLTAALIGAFFLRRLYDAKRPRPGQSPA